MIKRFYLFLFCVVLLPTAAFAQSEKDRILPILEHRFGKSIDTKLNLYELNEYFVISPHFDLHGTLVTVSVIPKYFLNDSHPEWEEPYERPHLLPNEYNVAVSIFSSIKPFGRLLARYEDPSITNSTIYRHEYYDKADLTYLESFYFDRNTDKERVRSISINFSHTVIGNIIGKKFDRFDTNHPFLGCTSDACYYVDRSTYRRLKENVNSTFEGIVAPDYVTLHNFGRKHQQLKLRVKKEKSSWAKQSSFLRFS